MQRMRRICLASFASLLALLVLLPAAHGADILVDGYCVTASGFYFSVEIVDLPVGTAIVRIASSGDAFASPVERIALNFDTQTGEVTSGPTVETASVPPWIGGRTASSAATSWSPSAPNPIASPAASTTGPTPTSREGRSPRPSCVPPGEGTS